jgi:Protein of unknown function (DUF429)
MPPRFARFIAIDWSGARLPAAQRRAIVCCVVEGHRVTAFEAGRDRQEIVAWLADHGTAGVPTLVGLDFPFAYTAPFLDHLRVPDFAALLARIAPFESRPQSRNCADAFITRCGRWWARWSKSEDHQTRRHVERVAATRGAESPLRALPLGPGYRFVGPRQVGKAAITGIAALAALKARIPGARVWPFEDPAGASLVLAEIWPRLALAGVVKSDPAARRRHVRALGHSGVQLRPEHRRIAAASDHAVDALAAAVAMASGRWPMLERSALPSDAVREGWILGVEPSCRPRAQPVTSPRARQ